MLADEGKHREKNILSHVKIISHELKSFISAQLGILGIKISATMFEGITSQARCFILCTDLGLVVSSALPSEMQSPEQRAHGRIVVL